MSSVENRARKRADVAREPSLCEPHISTSATIVCKTRVLVDAPFRQTLPSVRSRPHGRGKATATATATLRASPPPSGDGTVRHRFVNGGKRLRPPRNGQVHPSESGERAREAGTKERLAMILTTSSSRKSALRRASARQSSTRQSGLQGCDAAVASVRSCPVSTARNEAKRSKCGANVAGGLHDFTTLRAAQRACLPPCMRPRCMLPRCVPPALRRRCPSASPVGNRGGSRLGAGTIRAATTAAPFSQAHDEPVGSMARAAHRNHQASWLECCTSSAEAPFRQLTLHEGRLNEESIALAIS